MNILEHVKQSIDDGMPAELEMRNGEAGVLFLDEHEFIPFDDLNYNSDLGYFRISLFPDARRECENEPVTERNLNAGAPGRSWAQNDTRVVGYVPSRWADELERLGKNRSDAVRTALDVALHPLDPFESSPLRLADSLPCGTRTVNGVCGKPATVAYVYRWNHPLHPGHFALMPVCRGCAQAAAEVYDG